MNLSASYHFWGDVPLRTGQLSHWRQCSMNRDCAGEWDPQAEVTTGVFRDLGAGGILMDSAVGIWISGI